MEIGDARGGDRLLKDVLRALSFDVVVEDGNRFLVSECFETLDKAKEVHELAWRVYTVFEEVVKYNDQLTVGFRLGSVIEESEDGSRRKHGFARLNTGVLAAVSLSATATVGVSQRVTEEDRQRLKEEQEEREYQQLSRRAMSRIVSAFVDTKALQVQRLLKGELTPQTLGHIADLIRDDLGSAIVSLASNNQWKRFRHSINHPDVFGEQARHVTSRRTPPPNPMSLSEAQGFIRHVADSWLERKAGLNEPQ